jgi:type ISP restriction-modification system protein
LWNDAEAGEPNVAPGLLERLTRAYGHAVTPEMLFGYCYALLGTPAYQANFEAELREPPARVPFTADGELFARVAGAGQQLLRIHTFEEVPIGHARPGEPIDERLSNYSVSGLRVVTSWLRYRRAEPWTDTLERELVELLWLLEATLDLQPRLDGLLNEVVRGGTLERDVWSGR